ncbi:MAG: chloride channel protein [Desulfobacterales bacterium]
MVIGGAMGGVVGKVFHDIMPGIVTHPESFIVVGMAGFFTAVSNTPISTIIFVSEMTDSYQLLLPSLFVCAISFMVSGPRTIYQKQVKNRVASAAHAGEFMVDVLQMIKVQDLVHLVKKVETIPQNMPFLEFKQFFSRTKQHYFPVMDDSSRMIGIFSSTDIRKIVLKPEIEVTTGGDADNRCSEVVTAIRSRGDLKKVLQEISTFFKILIPLPWFGATSSSQQHAQPAGCDCLLITGRSSA